MEAKLPTSDSPCDSPGVLSLDELLDQSWADSMTGAGTHSSVTEHDASIPLSQATFVVVDLETTGGNPRTDAITEIGAVKIQGGVTIGEFRTFVNPGRPIPAFISVLTGITDLHVAMAPNIAQALTSFLEFAGFSGRHHDAPILVAHNAKFDVGFLKAACEHLDLNWPTPCVLDTVTLARRVLRGSEVRNRKLGTLAAFFGSPTTPNHRALDDARATVHVLHALMERVGNLGVHDVDSLLNFDGPNTEKRRRKRHLAIDVPSAPGVYIFHDSADRPLYIGTSRNLRTRVMSYFTAAESRRKMTPMIQLAHRVQSVVCATTLEANVRELRLIHDLQPRFNHKSRHPQRTVWVALTTELLPRLAIVRHINPLNLDRTVIGPFSNASQAQDAIDALHDAFPLRQCKTRFTSKGNGFACALLEMGRCHAPCLDTTQTLAYDCVVDDVRDALTQNLSSLVSSLQEKMTQHSNDLKYEDAALVLNRLTHVANAAHRTASLASLTQIPQIVAARATESGGWDIHVIKHGWLAATAHAPLGSDPVATAKAAVLSSATLPNTPILISEVSLIHEWLTRKHTRLVNISDGFEWHVPTRVAPYGFAKSEETEIKDASTFMALPSSMAR